MADYFQSEIGRLLNGFVLTVRAQVAERIIEHCALIAGKEDGEDSAGRSKIVAMASPDIATRANDIADALVTDWEARGWIKPTSTSFEEEAQLLGGLERIKSREAYKTVREELMGEKSKERESR